MVHHQKLGIWHGEFLDVQFIGGGDYRIVWEQMPTHNSVMAASEVWISGGKLGELHGGTKAITARLRQIENELSEINYLLAVLGIGYGSANSDLSEAGKLLSIITRKLK